VATARAAAQITLIWSIADLLELNPATAPNGGSVRDHRNQRM
jgi:hypothetical protein